MSNLLNQAHFRFYAELNDFLRPNRRMCGFVYAFENSPSVKDIIEALGVPHTEVDLILANSESVDFTYRLQDADRISVYPVFEAIDITSLLRVRPKPLRETRFIVDVNLGKLAIFLRMAGFDTLYRNDYEDAELAQAAPEEKRILLTRDRGLLKRSAVTHGYYLRTSDPKQQLFEVLRRFDLFRSLIPFHRCLRCNGTVGPVAKAEVEDRLPFKTKKHFNTFYRCQTCDRVFWKGSHYRKMERFIADIARKETEKNNKV
ncbi:MAG: Mut7-C ubiquitin/RNAse domain-containing protein [Gammaproteobacteria bacterium]|nr:Mut7-C ubiquitin/RNAse domain-containing protein [Gammaproteobacteria bacterium]